MRIFALPLLLLLGAAPEQDTPAAGSLEAGAGPFLAKHCFDCHDGDTKKGGLDLKALSRRLDSKDGFAAWVKVHDRVRDGEMPPPKKAQPESAERASMLEALGKELLSADLARAKRDGRSELRRLNRVELENSLRDLLGLEGFRIKDALPEDGRSHGFDRLSSALDLSFVHLETYLAAVDSALNQALCAFPEKPPVFKYRYSPWHPTRHNGRECDHWMGMSVQHRTVVPLIGMERDETFRAESSFKVVDDEPKATAAAIFRNEDADFRCSLGFHPVLSGTHKLRVSGYSVAWDGRKIVPTERHGAFSFGLYSRNEHYGTGGVPPNRAGVVEVTAWLERGGGRTHGTDDNIRLIPSSVQKIRDFRVDKEKTKGPPVPAPGLAIEWIEIEGPIHDQWPPAGHRALFGDLPVAVWTKDSGAPLPRQQKWPQGNPGSHPKDVYGERGQNRPLVHVPSANPAADAERLLKRFLRRAFRRPVTSSELSTYQAIVISRLATGAAFQDAMIAAYRTALSSPEFLLLPEPAGKLNDHALAQRLSYFLWSSIPDGRLAELADRAELGKADVLRAETERMLKDPKAKRFVDNFLGQWLNLRDINATQPDSKLYPEFMPWHQEAMVLETQAYFSELLEKDLGVERLVKSDFAFLNEPLAELYGVPDVRGWDLRKVALPEGHPRGGGFLTQGAVLKVTANGTTTSPVKRGAFVMEKILGIVPTPPPPDAGSIEPDVRGAVTVRQQLEKHRANPSCAGCHQKMDGYGFALESFDVMGERRDKYRAVGGGLDKTLHGHKVQYHFGPAVDCAGTMPDGRPFKNAIELRELLAAEPEKLARAFVGHLLVYATGGELSFADRAAVDAVARRGAGKAWGLRTLLHETIQSETFRTK